MVIADLHIHSRYSRATSRDGDLEHLDLWARKKGVGLVGTGDFTHPAWRMELREKLEPAEEGLYVLKKPYRLLDEGESPRFVVTGEISSIYKRDGKTRKVHNLLLLPSLEKGEELSERLSQVGNLNADGRPILKLDSEDLLGMLLDTSPEGELIPAHIWTPHFSMFGAFSAFSTLEECFGDLAGHIHGIETGLSSDPPMNAGVPALEGLRLISNSDAHSPGKLGREASLLEIDLSYQNLLDAIRQGEESGWRGTIEFFPQEGKYHWDGHRACGVSMAPEEGEKRGNICPVCGKKMTVGVCHRVLELSGAGKADMAPYESLAPLPETIAASLGVGVTSVKVKRLYESLLCQLGPEFFILRQAKIEDVEKVAGACVAQGLLNLREGKVCWEPGYDGVYGKLHLLTEQEREELK